MKTFMEEYGLASVMAACAMFLVVMATPVGGAINSGLQGATTSVENSGTNAEANAAKSIKSLAGEEEEIPDTIFVGYNSQNHCLVFSHSEDSGGYSNCDVKYGDISDNSAFSAWAPSPYMTNPAPYESFRSSITSVNIENKIKPKNMTYWFADMNNITSLDVSNIDSSNCESMSGCFAAKNISNITYGAKFVKPSTVDYMFASPSTMRSATDTLISNGGKNTTITLEQAPRPSWYDLDKVINTETTCTDGWNWTYSVNCEGYKKLLAYNYYNKNDSSFTNMKFYKVNSSEKKSTFLDENGIVVQELGQLDLNKTGKFALPVPTNAKTAKIEASLGSGPPLNYNGNNQEQKFTMKVLLVK